MAKINMVKTHQMDLETAKQKLDTVAKDLNSRFGIKSNWNGNICNLKGTGIRSGEVLVSENDIKIDITLGLLASALKSKIEAQIEQEFSKHFS